MPHEFGFETKMLHAGHVPDKETGARAVPIYQTTSYVFDNADYAASLFSLQQYGHIYSRISNPTTAVLEERLASLENGIGALALSSGQAALFNTIFTICQPGDEIVSAATLYGGTHTQMEHSLKKLSIKTHFVDPDDPENFAKAITPKTKLLYGETIGNPKNNVLDIEKVSDIAKAHNLPFMIDNTFATPYLCRPLDHGADLVSHSATKFIGGHGTSIGGAIVDAGRFDWSRYPAIAEPSASYHDLKFAETFGMYGLLMKIRTESLRDLGSCLSPFNAFLLIQGLETLSLRMERHCQNALTVAEFLSGHPTVAWVQYAGLKDNPYYPLAQKYLSRGAGAVFTFGIKGGRENGKRFIEALQLFSHLANVGDAKSLVIHPASTTHQQMTDAELISCGVTPDMIRLSIGLETKEDLLWDLDQALRASKSES